MVRWIFRPFCHIWKAICTSAFLRASTRISSGFALHSKSSPSFGSQKKDSNEFQIYFKLSAVQKTSGRPSLYPTYQELVSFRCQRCKRQNLALFLNSLARVSRRVNKRRSTPSKLPFVARFKQKLLTFSFKPASMPSRWTVSAHWTRDTQTNPNKRQHTSAQIGIQSCNKMEKWFKIAPNKPDQDVLGFPKKTTSAPTLLLAENNSGWYEREQKCKPVFPPILIFPSPL